MTLPMKIYAVTQIQVTQLPGGERTLIVASGQVSTSGWKNAHLKVAEPELSPDGILDLDFLAEPPTGISLPTLFPVSAQFDWINSNGVLRGVTVHVRTVTPGSSVLIDASLPESAIASINPVTTLVIGEEANRWPPPITKEFLGETWPPRFPTKALIGESGPFERETQDDVFRPYRRGTTPFPPREGGS